MSETTPKDHLIILCEFLAGNKTLATSSSIRARVNCSSTSVKLYLSCTIHSSTFEERISRTPQLYITSHSNAYNNCSKLKMALWLTYLLSGTYVYRIVGTFGGGKGGELTQRKKAWRINRSANRLLIVIANLDGFSLANHG